MGLGSFLKKAASVAIPAAIGYAVGGPAGAAKGGSSGIFSSLTGGDVLSAGASLAGDAVSAYGASQQNKAAAREADTNRSFQERLSNSSYQRAMADMKAAGLNPILAYKQGGASVPSGSVAPVANTLADVDPAQAVSSAMQLRQAKEDIFQTRAQTRKIEQDRRLNFQLERKAIHDADMSKLTKERFEKTGDSLLGRNLDTGLKIAPRIQERVDDLLDALGGFYRKNRPQHWPKQIWE